MRRKGLMAGLVAVVSAGSILSAGNKRVPPTTLDKLASVWVGTEPGDTLEYYRLELRPDGTGLLTLQELPDRPAWAYRVTQASLKGYAISFTLAAVDTAAEPVSLRGTATSGGLSLEVSGTNLDWKRKIELERLDHFMGRLNAVTDRANAYWSQARQ